MQYLLKVRLQFVGMWFRIYCNFFKSFCSHWNRYRRKGLAAGGRNWGYLHKLHRIWNGMPMSGPLWHYESGFSWSTDKSLLGVGKKIACQFDMVPFILFCPSRKVFVHPSISNPVSSSYPVYDACFWPTDVWCSGCKNRSTVYLTVPCQVIVLISQ